MADDEPVELTADEAIAMLPEGNTIHTFRNPALDVLIGADWSRNEIIDYIKNHPMQLSGETATSMNHGIVAGNGRGEYLFIETKKGD